MQAVLSCRLAGPKRALNGPRQRQENIALVTDRLIFGRLAVYLVLVFVGACVRVAYGPQIGAVPRSDGVNGLVSCNELLQ